MQCQCYAVFGLEGAVAFDSESAAVLLHIRSIQHFLQGFFYCSVECLHQRASFSVSFFTFPAMESQANCILMYALV